MNSSLIDTAYQIGLAMNSAQYEADVLEAEIKQHAKDEEANYAAFIVANAGDQYKALSSSSTVALVRKAIEADIVARYGYKPLYNTLQDQIDLAAAQQRYRNLRVEWAMHTNHFYDEFADTFGTMKKVFAPEQLPGVAQSVLPLVPPAKPWGK